VIAMTKQESIDFLLKVLKSPMAMTSASTRDKAFETASEHNITAVELLTRYKELIWNV